MGDETFGIDPSVLKMIASEVHDVHGVGVEIAIVIGGGNIFRGLQSSKYNISRVPAVTRKCDEGIIFDHSKFTLMRALNNDLFAWSNRLTS